MWEVLELFQVEQEAISVGIGDKIGNTAQDAKGKIKESAGKASGDDQMEAEGRIDQAKANAKDAIEGVKDKAAEAFNKVTGKDEE
ncbi:Uncharacterized conserved protein YjbJ, UPF0337 family [Micrococcales bacterium KH10]|nr:Uncharacterized conserved protein YjbJ, UPF0337 family [Micrococcales bacterium KH10]